ncbi:GNAT family N-acetyltransferase [Paenibacillus sp. SC116]|uniref:GNAT family N-acetyltransferase n=1 Tax=Paenibacillus sp. SC116 TaxID=2968986 RepID=UPI00215B0F32|nr:GNAT family N-acetyltransferase [Paenibacillus sp. SC116]MCR8845878.1 GNAT family N-acetyltransferase [Paenibacillus sp. SC116]
MKLYVESKEGIELVEVQEEEKSILRQLLELYEYDFSEFNDRDVNKFGLYGYTYFDHYWTEDDRNAYFIKVNGHFAGFVMINEHCYLYPSGTAKSIAEFFVMRKYRKSGVGREAAVQIFDTYKGNWEVLQHGENDASKLFWEKVIHAYSNGQYELKDVVTEDWTGQGIVFNNADR